jgi:hypothetical protein
MIKKNTERFWNAVVSPIVSVLLQGEGIENWEDYFGYRQWLWAMSIVSSRSSFVEEQGLSIVLGMDMFNHKFYNEKHKPVKFVDSNGDFVLKSKQMYPKNSQIFIDYKLPNTELLLFHGFIDPKFERSVVRFPFGFDRNDPLIDDKLQVLAKYGWQ